MNNRLYVKEIEIEDRHINIKNPMVFNLRKTKDGKVVASCESYGIVGRGNDDNDAMSDALMCVVYNWDDLCDFISESKKGIHLGRFDQFERLMVENFTELNLW